MRSSHARVYAPPKPESPASREWRLVSRRPVLSRRSAPRSPTWFPRVNEIIRLLGSHNLLAAPTSSQLADPNLRPLIDRYLPRRQGRVGRGSHPRCSGSPGTSSAVRSPSRNEQYERFYLASGARNYQMAHITAPTARAGKLVDRFLGEMTL